MVKEREQKHEEKRAFDQWKQENMVKPESEPETKTEAAKANPFAMIAR